MEHTRIAPTPYRPAGARATEGSPRRARLGRLARWGAAAGLGAAWMLLAGPAASAVPPVELGAGHVTDAADVLSASEESAANARLAAAFEETGIDLYVVFADEFTDPSDRIAWANETADLNGLGEAQYLLAVSTDGRQYFVSGLDDGALSEGQIAGIEEHVLPQLRDSDWAGAIDAAAAELEAAHAAPGRATAIAVGVGAGAVGLGGAAFGVTRAVRRRRAQAAAEADLVELERRAGSALVAADDAVRSSGQELEFARAQFGDAAVVEFRTALDTARAKILEAFSLRQQLDDAVPEADAERRDWLERILARCDEVDAVLDAQAGAFEQLRAIERDAPAALAALADRRRRLGDGADAAAELARLGTVYAAEELAALASAPEQAASLLAFAQDRERTAQAALGAGANAGSGPEGAGAATGTDAGAATGTGASATAPGAGAPNAGSGSAAVAIREGEAAVVQAEALLQQIAARAGELAELEQRAAALVAEIEQDVAGARALPDEGGAIAAAVQATEQQIAQARELLTSAPRRPSEALRALDAANTRIDGVVQAAQEAARTRQLLEANLAQAADQLRQAESYIEARRGAVGATARTRAAEARAALGRAEAARQADPQGALAEAQRAAALAAQALSAAQSDVTGFGGSGAGYGGGGIGGFGDPRSSGGDFGAILGGILGQGGGFGGSGGSGGGFWGGGSRSSGGSSWGGSSRRSSSGSRRSSGGSRRSSGGSRRSRGGGRF
ncbi:TPM domain-containing protein [Leucobacter allii]|uniref:TPM domain-containing protein n=1 Tax=Leucobacter allii TaxID=2932247 RepID=UPI001FD301A4|nr:TPM domain-containing protein [Leucobacter allii]UOR01025.1 TPM domain-containing protein [Leucobacter allii]